MQAAVDGNPVYDRRSIFADPLHENLLHPLLLLLLVESSCCLAQDATNTEIGCQHA
jgi:hypothetical protein